MNSEQWPPPGTPFLLFLIPPPLVSAAPVHGNPSVLSLSLSCTFCFGLWRKSVAQFSLRVCCCCFRKVFFIFFVLLPLLLLLARFIAFYSSLSVRRCFCGNEDLETAWKRCQRGIERHCGLSGEGGVARLWQRNLPPRRRPSKLSAAPNPSLRAGGVCRGSGAFCFDELLLRMSH